MFTPLLINYQMGLNESELAIPVVVWVFPD